MIKYLALMGLLGGLNPLMGAGGRETEPPQLEVIHPLAARGSALVGGSGLDYRPGMRRPKEVHIRAITAYTSAPEETDDTPFITASGKHVRLGTAAANWLPFGTEIRIPELFGDQVFVVEDRMHSRFSDKVDIWFEHKNEALKFGIRTAKIEVL